MDPVDVDNLEDAPDHAPAPPGADRWALLLHAVGPGPETPVRIRRALKHLLRAHGLRCSDFYVSKGRPAAQATAAAKPPRRRKSLAA